MDEIISLYKKTFGCNPEKIVPIAGEGSGRRYYRLSGVNGVCIATEGTNLRENRAFIYLSRYFSKRHLPVPEILAVADDEMKYLQTDVGDISLYDIILKNGIGSDCVEPLLHRIMELLPRFHYSVDAEFNTGMCFPRSSMDSRSLMWDMNYFKYSFLKPIGIDFDEDRLEDDFIRLTNAAMANPEKTIILRDFQSRNIMMNDGTPFVIDFQGARMGDGLYDVASFVWQARAGIPDDMKWRLVDTYRQSVESIVGKILDDFEKRLSVMVVIRLLQVLGAYGFRGYIEGKTRFVESIPAAVSSLFDASRSLPAELAPYLCQIIQAMAQLPSLKKSERLDGLTVTVESFSYKKGLPKDTSGNGGGYVFDCRGLHNPGRYEEYKHLTGMDKPVIEFLERQGEVQKFMTDCYGLVDASVECYIRRGFSDLMVCFGCTGGQHRSVYGAEHMAHHLNDKYGVRVRLIHREQNIDTIFDQK